MAPKSSTNFGAWHIRKHQVEYHEIGPSIGHTSESLASGGGRLDRETFLCQTKTHQLQDVGLVVDDQDVIAH